MREFKITEKTLIDVLQYLAQRPYQEVAEIIEVLRQLEQIEEEASNEDGREG